MIDYIQVAKHVWDKDRLFLGHLELEAQYSSGWSKYRLDGCEKLELYWNPETSILRLRGSIMYYWQGHNFSYSKKGFFEAIECINRMLNVNLWASTVQAFEFGVIMEVDHKPKEYIKRHDAFQNENLTKEEKGKDKGNFRWWDDVNVKLKMYDASKNILMKQGYKRRTVIEKEGWNPEGYFLKFEAHYKKPEVLNHGKILVLADLVNQKWKAIFKEDLYMQYKRLKPMRTIIKPTTKKDLNCTNILLIGIVNSVLDRGGSIEDAKERVYALVNELDALNKMDKDQRKRQYKLFLEKIKESPESDWDLSEKLEKSLSEE